MLAGPLLAVGHLGVGSRPALPGRGLAPFFATSSKALGGWQMTPLEGWVFGGHVFSLFTRSLLLMEEIVWRFSVEVDMFFQDFFSIPLYIYMLFQNILQGGARVLSSTIG